MLDKRQPKRRIVRNSGLTGPSAEEIGQGARGYKEIYGSRALAAIDQHMDQEYAEHGLTFRYQFLVAVRENLAGTTTGAADIEPSTKQGVASS
jgi:hypothetical protein